MSAHSYVVLLLQAIETSKIILATYAKFKLAINMLWLGKNTSERLFLIPYDQLNQLQIDTKSNTAYLCYPKSGIGSRFFKLHYSRIIPWYVLGIFEWDNVIHPKESPNVAS
ncbi:hypothetical protein TI04_06320 [Achromatium sp. WMS2]|nr:hypothetical protein TI04_06320 [Achromatium sp. WMS2]